MINALGLQYMIENDLFVVCPPKSTDWFIKYCAERGITTSAAQLESFERLGLFYPTARVRHPQASFWFRNDQVKILFSQGDIWDPSDRPFQPWSSFRDENGRKQIGNFYSQFQIYPLYYLQKATELSRIRAERWSAMSEEEIGAFVERVTTRAKEVVAENQASKLPIRDRIARVCQVISNRYFPYTQGDRRNIRISTGNTLGEWDWFKYQNDWDAKLVLSAMPFDAEVLERLSYSVGADAERIDPLDAWRELVRFVSIDKKKKLTGDAQLALVFRGMAYMLELFHRDVIGKAGGADDELDSIYGKGVSENDLKYLEYLTNEFHLNPRPKLILVVEGHGEYDQLPRVADELFGLSFPKMEIEVMNLQGVSTFVGDSKTDKYGALEKFIDFNHNRQTIVFIILDKEGKPSPETIKAKLIAKDSHYFKKRKVTRAEYLHIWDKSIEFDNFDNDEIASALTKLSEDNYKFNPADIEACRNSNEGDPLDGLFNSFTEGKYSLNKRALLATLFEGILGLSKEEYDNRKIGQKPIVKVLQMLMYLAGRNYQPQSDDAWEENQKTGLFGHVTGEEEKKTAEYLAQLCVPFRD
jgi:hypothetical protein